MSPLRRNLLAAKRKTGESAKRPVASLMRLDPRATTGKDLIREAEELRRRDPVALRHAARAHLKAYEAAIDDVGHEPDPRKWLLRSLKTREAAYRAALLLDLRGLELWDDEWGEPELRGTVTAIEDDPTDGPVLTIVLPRRPRQRKDRVERLTLDEAIRGQSHLRLPGDAQSDSDEAMLQALRSRPLRPHPNAPAGDYGKPVGGRGTVPPWLAYHEAGHAVTQIALDQLMPEAPAPIERVIGRRRDAWKKPYTDMYGRIRDGIQGIVEGRDRCRDHEWELAVQHGGPSLASARKALWLQVLFCLAGPAAEAKWRGTTEKVLPSTLVMLGDGKQALEDLRRLGREDDLPTAWHEARALVEDIWPAIEAVAQALLKRHRLTGEEVERLAAAAMPQRFPLVEEVR
jgi:hypothetical protein